MLATDYIDLLFSHSPFSAREIDDDVWESLERLKEEGKVWFVSHLISKLEDTQDMARV